MPKFAALTDQENARLSDFKATYTKWVISTDRLDPDAVRMAITALYEAAKKPAPEHIVITPSPLQALWFCAAMMEGGDFGKDQLDDGALAQLAALKKADIGKSSLAKVLGMKVYDKINTQYMKLSVPSDIHDQMNEALTYMLGQYLQQKAGPEKALFPVKTALAAHRGIPSFKMPLKDPTMDAMECGALAAPSLSLNVPRFAYLHDVRGLFEDGRGLYAVAEHCGSVWPFKNVAIVSERPTDILYDVNHPEPWTLPAPAVAFADGSQI